MACPAGARHVLFFLFSIFIDPHEHGAVLGIDELLYTAEVGGIDHGTAEAGADVLSVFGLGDALEAVEDDAAAEGVAIGLVESVEAVGGAPSALVFLPDGVDALRGAVALGRVGEVDFFVVVVFAVAVCDEGFVDDRAGAEVHDIEAAAVGGDAVVYDDGVLGVVAGFLGVLVEKSGIGLEEGFLCAYECVGARLAAGAAGGGVGVGVPCVELVLECGGHGGDVGKQTEGEQRSHDS